MTNKNKRSAGRPVGARGKTNASNEIEQALRKGAGLLELKNFLWGRIQDDNVTEAQKTKFVDQYTKLMQFIHSEALKIEIEQSPKNNKEKEHSSDIQKGEHTENKNSKDAPVRKFVAGGNK